MILKSNEGKKVEIETSTGRYARYAIKTHFVEVGEDYFKLIERYVLPVYSEGDLLSCSEKVPALCQGRVIKKEDMRLSATARLLSKFASHPSHGIGVGEPLKMQFAIDSVGLFRVLFASAVSAVTKLFGKKGVFYEIVGEEVSGLDGFYDHVFEEYGDIGIMNPENPEGLCDEIYNRYGVSAAIVDANDYGQTMFGKSKSIALTDEQFLEIIRDNPAGQGRECTPFILIREIKS